MPAMNQKNMMLQGASFDLGLSGGTQLNEQMAAKMDEIRKKKRGEGDLTGGGSAADMLLTPLFGTGASGGTNG